MKKENQRETTIKDSLIVLKNSRKYLTKFYNLDVIIAVGYRSTKKLTKFRIWATRVLRDYLVKGFALEKRKLSGSPESLDGLHEAITLIESNEHSWCFEREAHS